MTWILYHYPLCPFSRKIRIILKEKNIPFELKTEKFWLKNKDFLDFDTLTNTPVLIHDELIMYGNYAIFEYLEAFSMPILPESLELRYKARSISEWFDTKFFNEVVRTLIKEKVIKIELSTSYNLPPDSSLIRESKRKLSLYLAEIKDSLDRQSQYFCGDAPGLGDFSAAAQISVLDFLGDMIWDNNTVIKNWYALIKSRPSFKEILKDTITSIKPPVYYSDPDF